MSVMTPIHDGGVHFTRLFVALSLSCMNFIKGVRENEILGLARLNSEPPAGAGGAWLMHEFGGLAD